MDVQRFIQQLSDQFVNWGQETVCPKSEQFQTALDQISGMTTANVMQLLNFAVDCLAPGELYCEIGTYHGSTLVGALLNHPDCLAYAVDNFSEFDQDDRNLQALMANLTHFGLDEQVYFCNQDFQQFLMELHDLDSDDKIGVYFYDGAHDYRSTLLGLLLVKPLLAEQALIIVDDANWGTVQQAYWDFLAMTPEASLCLELSTPVARYPTFWNGIHVLSWDRSQRSNYPVATVVDRRHPSVLKAIYNLQLLEQREQDLETLYKEALHWHEQKRLPEAEKKYRDFLLWREDDARAWRGLGLLYLESEDYAASQSALCKAVEFDPTNGLNYFYLGTVLEQAGLRAAAIAAYQQAIGLDATLMEAYNCLGLLLSQHNAIEQAMAVYQQGIAHVPTVPGLYQNLGNLLVEQGDLVGAIATYQTGLQLDPNNLDMAQSLEFAREAQQHPLQYHQRLGQLHYQRHHYQTAIHHFERYLEHQAVNQQPGDPTVYLELSQSFWQLNQPDRALQTLETGIAHWPLAESLHYELIQKQMAAGHTAATFAAAEFALKQCPHSYTLKLLNSLILPYIYDTTAEIDFYRDRYTRELDRVVQQTKLDTPDEKAEALAGISRFGSFQLTYQARDMLPLQRVYGGLVHQIMAANFPQWVEAIAMPPVTGKIRLGYLSHYFHAYSGTLWLTGWLRHANPQDFEIYCYYTGNAPDAITQEFQQFSAVFRHIPGTIEMICQQVIADQLHLLVFPEIGMDPQTIQLAALRLAPVQCTAWGHPVTSGLPTIDYYLSSQLMEPAAAQEHYGETLIQLPKIGIAYPFPDVPPLTKTRADFGIRADAAVFFCGQAPFKYLPQHDYLLVEIARRLPQAQFIFIRADVLKPRLHRAFAAAGLELTDYALFLPVQARNDYLMLNLLSDVDLDTLEFTGGNTTLDAIACGLPVVTVPGKFMRGCLSTGILQALGVTDTIATHEASYIDIAVRLIQDPDWRAQISQAMRQKHSQLFDDPTCMAALESFYRQVVGAEVSARG